MSSTTPPATSGASFLQYTGIPTSWLQKRPRLPSRNWLIFLSISTTLTGLYLYDRRKCRQIRDAYVNKVRHLSEEPLPSLAFPRKVTVYGSKWPGDEDADRSLKYFRKYVKPILVAAAIDYEMVGGKRLGNLADTVANKVKSRRRIELGLEPPVFAPPMPGLGRDEQLKRELEGGIIIIGRQTFKEFMHGLKRGWSEPLDLVDKEELLSQELHTDGVFDEKDASDSNLSPEDHSLSEKGSIGTSFHFPRHLNNPPKHSSRKPESSRIEPRLNTPPSAVPLYPPILLVPFTNLVGLSLVPLMIWEFFNERRKVREGAEAAYRLVLGNSRPIYGPSSSIGHPDEVEQDPSSDLSFGLKAETYYKTSTLVSDTEKARRSYYEELPAKIKVARELAWGEREPTKDEQKFPPPTEVELRSERMNKELRWRDDLVGWAIVNPASPVAWDPKFSEALSLYVDGEEPNKNEQLPH